MTPEGPTPAPAPAEPDVVLDVKGLDCPVSILRTRMALKSTSLGQTVHVLATDPHSVLDFKAFSVRTGHERVHLVDGPDVFEFRVRCKRAVSRIQ